MDIFLVKNDADEKIREKLAQLMLGQMEAIGNSDSYLLLVAAIDLALMDGSTAKIFAVAEDDNIIALAFLNIGISLEQGGQYIWLSDLYVHKNFRQRGIARKLLLHIIFWAEKNNLKSIELETGINNIATKRLYNSLGFYDIISKRYGLDVN